MTERDQDKKIKKLENDVRYLLHVIASGGVTSTFEGLTDGPGSFVGNALEIVRVNATETALEYTTLSGGGNALTSDPLSQFAATTSAQLAGVISNETGSGLLVFNTSPLFVTPRLNSTSTTGHVWTATDSSGNGSFQAIAANLLVDSSGTGEPIWTTSLDTLHFATINNATTGVDDSLTISTIYEANGTLISDRTIDLGGSFISVTQGGNEFLHLDPDPGSEHAHLQAYNITGLDNISTFTANTNNTSSIALVSASFNGGVKAAEISFLANTTVSTLDYSADEHTFIGTITLDNLSGNGAGIVAVDNNGLLSWSAGSAGTFVGLTDGPGAFATNSLKVVRVNAGETALEYVTLAGGGDALTSGTLAQFAATTSAQLAGVISDETGSGALVFATSPLFVTPRLNSASTVGHVWTATDTSGNGSFQAAAGGSPALTQYRIGIGDASNLLTSNAAITGDRALISDTNGVPTHATTTATELGYLSGVTSAIQTQLINKTFAINVFSLNVAAPADGAIQYFGYFPAVWHTTATIYEINIDKDCTLIGANIEMQCSTAGTDEDWTCYVRVNNTTDYTISTLGISAARRTWTNTAMNTTGITLVAGDKIVVKFINPTWATNPATCTPAGYLRFIES